MVGGGALVTLGRRDAWLLVALCLAIALPFLNKPFHIDDPFILMISGNVIDNAANPFAGFSSWFGRPDPVWRMATNPPLISYYLAPFAAISDYDEIVLHAAMIPFLVLLAFSLFELGRRFTSSPWFSVCFVMTSPGIVVSGNVMRDIPTLALATAAIAASVRGCDRSDWRWLLSGAVLAGAALLTKYSAAVILPLIVLYPLLKGRLRAVAFVAVPLLMLAAWSAQNQWMHGETQIGLLLTRDWGHLASWQDNLSGLPVVAGSLLFLVPVLLASALRAGDYFARSVPFALAGVMFATQYYLQGLADLQYLFWSLSGSALIALCLAEGVRGAFPLRFDLRDESGSDSLFLFAWLCAPLLFSVIFVPFQAVRHLLPALPPLVLLGLRALNRARAAGGLSERTEGRALLLLLLLQSAVALTVATADYEHAAAYRNFARDTAARAHELPGETWFIPHWGWSFYGERAGFRQLVPGGPYPLVGDRVVQPSNYFNGSVPSGRGPGGRQPPRMVEVQQTPYAPRIRLRAMHPAGAGFYAMYSRRENALPNIPYRWLPAYPLESFSTLRATR